MQAHLLDDVFRGTRRQHRRHDAAFAAGVFDAVQDVREERTGREVVVLTMQEEGEPADAWAQLGVVVAELARGLDDPQAGGVGEAGLVLQRAGDGADRHAGGAGDIADGCGHLGGRRALG
jgi:hypothetical protein